MTKLLCLNWKYKNHYTLELRKADGQLVASIEITDSNYCNCYLEQNPSEDLIDSIRGVDNAKDLIQRRLNVQFIDDKLRHMV